MRKDNKLNRLTKHRNGKFIVLVNGIKAGSFSSYKLASTFANQIEEDYLRNEIDVVVEIFANSELVCA
mgnify:CR=1 FL=1